MENNIDKQVDEALEQCILSSPRKSFFLFAGAGSGKTHSLVLLLKKIHQSIGKEISLLGKNVAVITYTNAATDEIINRLDYSPVFHISTIHSFVWDIIKYYQGDIRKLYCHYLKEDIQEIVTVLCDPVCEKYEVKGNMLCFNARLCICVIGKGKVSEDGTFEYLSENYEIPVKHEWVLNRSCQGSCVQSGVDVS